MTGCCAAGCSSRPETGAKLYQFPRDPRRRGVWADLVHRPGWKPGQWSRLCQAHFDDDQFENRRADGKRKLKWNAVPTLFSHGKVSKPRKPPARRLTPAPKDEPVAQSDHTYTATEPKKKPSIVGKDTLREEETGRDEPAYPSRPGGGEGQTTKQQAMDTQETRITWSREAENTLIELVRDQPSLWNASDENFMKRRFRKRLFASVAETLSTLYPQLGSFSADVVRKKFANLKGYYIRVKRKCENPSSGGDVAVKGSMYKRLEFLDDQPSQRARHTWRNLGIDSDLPLCVVLSVNNPATMDVSSRTDQISENVTPLHEVIQTSTAPLCDLPWSCQVTSDVESSSDSSSSVSDAPAMDIPRTRRKRARKPNTHTNDAASHSYSQLKDITSSEQDFAYGVGIMLVNRIRNLSTKNQESFVTQALELLAELSQDEEAA